MQPMHIQENDGAFFFLLFHFAHSLPIHFYFSSYFCFRSRTCGTNCRLILLRLRWTLKCELSTQTQYLSASELDKNHTSGKSIYVVPQSHCVSIWRSGAASQNSLIFCCCRGWNRCKFGRIQNVIVIVVNWNIQCKNLRPSWWLRRSVKFIIAIDVCVRPLVVSIEENKKGISIFLT